MRVRKGQRKARFCESGTWELQDAYVDDRANMGLALMLRTVAMEHLQEMIAKDGHDVKNGCPEFVAADDKGHAWFYPLPDAACEIRVRFITYHEV